MSNRNRKETTKRLHFLADLIDVYRKHGMSLGHEDIHGLFTIELLSDDNIEWLKSADDKTTEDKRNDSH